ncbi:MAG TPA: hypothetical protein PKC28_06195 [Bdellovibrionales bacterium]|nr:hypothetical protein [Bdellovibrionales bacterium]
MKFKAISLISLFFLSGLAQADMTLQGLSWGDNGRLIVNVEADGDPVVLKDYLQDNESVTATSEDGVIQATMRSYGDMFGTLVVATTTGEQVYGFLLKRDKPGVKRMESVLERPIVGDGLLESDMNQMISATMDHKKWDVSQSFDAFKVYFTKNPTHTPGDFLTALERNLDVIGIPGLTKQPTEVAEQQPGETDDDDDYHMPGNENREEEPAIKQERRERRVEEDDGGGGGYFDRQARKQRGDSSTLEDICNLPNAPWFCGE